MNTHDAEPWTRYHRAAGTVALAMGILLLYGCGNAEPVASTSSGVREATQDSRAQDRDPELGEEPVPPPPGFNPFTTPSQRPVSPLRVGRGVGPDGTVLDSARTDVFMLYDPIHISAATEGLAPGTLGRLMIFKDGDENAVFSVVQTVAPSGAPFSFDLPPGKLPVERYRAVLAVSDEKVAEHAFVVKSGS
jgi:hypothetical protein